MAKEYTEWIDPGKKYPLSRSQRDYISWRDGKMYIGDEEIRAPTDVGGRDAWQGYYGKFGYGSPGSEDDPSAWLGWQGIKQLASYTYNKGGQHPGYASGENYARSRYYGYIDNFEKMGHPEGDYGRDNPMRDQVYGDYRTQQQWANDRSAFTVKEPPAPPPPTVPEPIDTPGAEPPVGGIDEEALAKYRAEWDQQQQDLIASLKSDWDTQYQSQIKDLTSAWGLEKSGFQEQLGGLQGQIGDLNLTIGEAEAQNRAYADEVKSLQEANIKATERERLMARYGTALEGDPTAPKVHGVKTAKIKDQPTARWYSPRNQFNRTGMRITNLNI